MKHLLWTHIATTGLDPAQDIILEMYMKVTDVHGENIGGREMTFYSGTPLLVPPKRLNSDVVHLHRDSGLLDDIKNRTHTFVDLDSDICGCLNEIPDGDIILAGYAPRFAYEFMRVSAPDAHKQLHFQQMDVTSLEMFTEAAFNQRIYPRPQALRVKAKVDSALDQYRTYLGVMKHLAER